MDVYDLAIEFTETMPQWHSSPGSLVFWYPDGDELSDLVESTYLWRYSTVQANGPGLPALDDHQRAQLRQRTPRYLVIMGSRPEFVEQGRAALDFLSDLQVGSSEHTLTVGSAELYFEVNEYRPASCDETSDGRLDVWLFEALCP